MATADRTAEKVVQVVQKGEITLVLTDEEAEALFGLLGHSVGAPFYSIYRALKNIDVSDEQYPNIKNDDGGRTIRPYHLVKGNN
jgi:hypothetical protein